MAIGLAPGDLQRTSASATATGVTASGATQQKVRLTVNACNKVILNIHAFALFGDASLRSARNADHTRQSGAQRRPRCSRFALATLGGLSAGLPALATLVVDFFLFVLHFIKYTL